MRRRREPDGPGSAESAPRPGAAPHALLALQQSAGNHAVTRMLSREEEAPEREPATIDVDGLGVIVLQSFQDGRVSGAGGGRRQSPDERDDVSLVLASRAGRHSPKLSQWAASGHIAESAALEAAGMFKIELENALISSYTAFAEQGEEVDHWTIEGRRKK